MKATLFLIISILLIGCVTSKKLNKISIGMYKQQVISLLGEPVSVSSQGENQEFLNYKFAETATEYNRGIRIPYYVLLENDQVVEYGRFGDFRASRNPNDDINTTSDIRTSSNHDRNEDLTSTERMQKELMALKELLDEGILTKSEFDLKKKEILNKY